jgi:hypothetical protein
MPHVTDSKLFILWRHKASRSVLVVVVVIFVLSLCCHCRVRAVKFARYHFGLAGCFTTYLSYLTSCDVVRCRAMSMSHRQSHAMWRDVARCGAMWRNVAQCRAMWDSDEFLLGFCYDCSSKKVSREISPKFLLNSCGTLFLCFSL